jgi:hypothetical protein
MSNDKAEWAETNLEYFTSYPIEEPKVKNDMVNNPAHYNAGGIECIDAILAATNDLAEGYIQGNIIKYVWRYRYKNRVEDLKKARWYLDKLIEIQLKK